MTFYLKYHKIIKMCLLVFNPSNIINMYKEELHFCVDKNKFNLIQYYVMALITHMEVSQLSLLDVRGNESERKIYKGRDFDQLRGTFLHVLLVIPERQITKRLIIIQKGKCM